MCLLLTTTIKHTLAAPTSTTTATTAKPTTTKDSTTVSSSPSTTTTTARTSTKETINISLSSPTETAAAEDVIRRASLLHSLSSQSYTSHSRLRKRHSKRQSNIVGGFDLDVNSTVLEWANPCGGFYDPTDVPNIKTNRTAILKTLKEAVEFEFIGLKDNLRHIDTKSFSYWSLHKKRYDFLPKLKWKPNMTEKLKMKSMSRKRSKVSLKRWYRNLQTYVATFAYLWRMQEKSRRSEADKDIAIELNSLLLSSRSMLCELEIAINKTNPNHQVHNHLRQISREEMNRHLNLITRQNTIKHPTVKHEVSSIDLIFSKVYYKRFLKKLKNIINDETEKRLRHKKMNRGNIDSTSFNGTTRRKQKKQKKGHSRT